MKIKYNTQQITEILKDLKSLTGITIVFLDLDGNSISPHEKDEDFCLVMQSDNSIKEKCSQSDYKLLNRCKNSGKYECHMCHLGLYDSAMPIIKSGITAGYILMGRIRSLKSPQKFTFSDNKKLSELYKKLPVFTDIQLESLRSLLANITFPSAIEIEQNETIEEIAEFIEKNITENLSVGFICKKFFISKNRLYKDFKEHYGCTFNEYVTNIRLEKAKELLLKTKEPIYAVCEKIGTDNYSYFSNLFKRKTGMSPSAFRNQNRV